MKFLIVSLVIVNSLSAFAINGKEFVDCFAKALNDRVAEIQEKSPKTKICDEISKKDKAKLYELYSYVAEDGNLYYYDDKAMGEMSVRFHYERIVWEVECYKNPNNIFSAWVKGFGNAVGAYKHTNMQLVEDSMTKLLGRKMWTENGSDLFSEHEFNYCYQE